MNKNLLQKHTNLFCGDYIYNYTRLLYKYILRNRLYIESEHSKLVTEHLMASKETMYDAITKRLRREHMEVIGTIDSLILSKILKISVFEDYLTYLIRMHSTKDNQYLSDKEQFLVKMVNSLMSRMMRENRFTREQWIKCKEALLPEVQLIMDNRPEQWTNIVEPNNKRSDLFLQPKTKSRNPKIDGKESSDNELAFYKWLEENFDEDAWLIKNKLTGFYNESMDENEPDDILKILSEIPQEILEGKDWRFRLDLAFEMYYAAKKAGNLDDIIDKKR